MKLKVNKRFVKAGEVVEVSWDSEIATSPRLIMHTGIRESSLAVPESGSKRFRLKGVKGQHWIGLKAWDGNQERLIKHRIFVYGKSRESDSFEYMDKQNWFDKLRQGVKRWWGMYTPEKKRLYVLLILLLVYNLLFSLALYNVAQILFMLIIFWLFWQIVKR